MEKLMRKLLSLNNTETFNLMKGIIKKYYPKNKIKIKEGEYIYAFGTTSPVLLVAHCDTVIELPRTDVYYDPVKEVFWRGDPEQVLGADDRAGIYLILRLLAATEHRPALLITMGEESGLTGARSFIEDFPEPNKSLPFLLELDYHGDKNVCFYGCENFSFRKFILDVTHFTQREGSYSDISVIAPVWKVAAANLSAGYDYEHSSFETLNMKHLQHTLDVLPVLLQSSKKKYFY